MAKLVTKFKYLKPGKKKKGGYARYIATREGVEKIDDSQKDEPATEKQESLTPSARLMVSSMAKEGENL